jgi:hypothetical protein
VITVEVLPGGNGDCLWISWPAADGEHRLLFDGGRGYSAALKARFAAQPAEHRAFDLVVCSHIDNDHINGLLTLFRTPPDGFRAGDVWFNSRDHLVPDALGTGQGDQLSELLGPARDRWNAAFGGRAVVVPDGGPLPERELTGMTITVLAPGPEQLAELLAVWPESQPVPEEPEPLPPDALGEETGSLAELASRPLDPDESPSNRSSIVLLLTHQDGARVLLAADAHADVLTAGLQRLDLPVPVDLATVPHHGSARNTSTELVDALDCRNWLISTNGRGGHGHPSRTAVARILARLDDPTFYFNYRSAPTDEFASEQVRLEFGATVHRPATGAPPGLRIAVRPGQVGLV